MKNRFHGVSIALILFAFCGVLGAVAQNAQGIKPALTSHDHDNRSVSLETYLVQNKAITHNQERKALWAALWKMWTKTFESSKVELAVNNGAKIALYAENASATELCFYRDGKVYTFDDHEGHIAPVVMAKVLPPINAITFQSGKRGPGFLLWCNGQIEASIDSSQE